MADPSKLAVLIDADNLSHTHAGAILREVTTYGEPGLRRVYGDWSNPQLGGWTKAAREFGLVQYQQTANTRGKNASDIGLVIDAMDILHEGRFGTFVLVSSDSDFTRLASRVREWGLEVIGIGERGKVPASLIAACNRFIMVENISGKKAAPDADKLRKFESLVVAALDKSDENSEWCSMSWLGKQLRLDNPDFDQRSYGEVKLSDLIAKLDKVETRLNESNHFILRLKPKRRRRA